MKWTSLLIVLFGLSHYSAAQELQNPCGSSTQLFFSHPFDATKFIQCTGEGRFFIQTCPDSLIWNSNIQSCFKSDDLKPQSVLTSQDSSSTLINSRRIKSGNDNSLDTIGSSTNQWGTQSQMGQVQTVQGDSSLLNSNPWGSPFDEKFDSLSQNLPKQFDSSLLPNSNPWGSPTDIKSSVTSIDSPIISNPWDSKQNVVSSTDDVKPNAVRKTMHRKLKTRKQKLDRVDAQPQVDVNPWGSNSQDSSLDFQLPLSGDSMQTTTTTTLAPQRRIQSQREKGLQSTYGETRDNVLPTQQSYGSENRDDIILSQLFAPQRVESLPIQSSYGQAQQRRDQFLPQFQYTQPATTTTTTTTTAAPQRRIAELIQSYGQTQQRDQFLPQFQYNQPPTTTTTTTVAPQRVESLPVQPIQSSYSQQRREQFLPQFQYTQPTTTTTVAPQRVESLPVQPIQSSYGQQRRDQFLPQFQYTQPTTTTTTTTVAPQRVESLPVQPIQSSYGQQRRDQFLPQFQYNQPPTTTTTTTTVAPQRVESLPVQPIQSSYGQAQQRRDQVLPQESLPQIQSYGGSFQSINGDNFPSTSDRQERLITKSDSLFNFGGVFTPNNEADFNTWANKLIELFNDIKTQGSVNLPDVSSVLELKDSVDKFLAENNVKIPISRVATNDIQNANIARLNPNSNPTQNVARFDSTVQQPFSNVQSNSQSNSQSFIKSVTFIPITDCSAITCSADQSCVTKIGCATCNPACNPIGNFEDANVVQITCANVKCPGSSQCALDKKDNLIKCVLM